MTDLGRPVELLVRADLPVLDTRHLTAQTFGDGALAREVLALFEAQCDALAPAIAAPAAPSDRRDALHTLRGAAAAVGASRLAAALTTLEEDCGAGRPGQRETGRLEAVLDEIRQARSASVQYRTSTP